MNIKKIALSDTIGVATPESISYLFSNLIPPYPDVEFGAHLHTRQDNWEEKVHAAYNSGCMRYDGALKGFGGCPMAKDDLTGNMPTENLIQYFKNLDLLKGIDLGQFQKCMFATNKVFPN